MTREFEVAVKLTVDGKTLISEARAAKEALGGLGDTARKTGGDFGEANKQSAAASEALGGLGNTARKTSGDLGEAGRQSDVLEASAARLKIGLVAATAAMGAFAVSSISSSRDFSKSIRAISTQLDDGTDQVKEFEAASESLAVQFGTMPIEQSQAFYEILSAGITDTTKATDLLIEANKLAIGGNANLQATIDGLTSIMKGYGDKIADVKDVSDAFFVSSLAGKISIEELATGLGRVVPLAETLNVSFDELSAATAALTLGGISASESITGVRAVLASIAKPSIEASGLAKELGLEFNAAALQSKGLAAFLDDLKQKTGGSADALAILFGGVEAYIPAVALAGNAGKEFNAIMEQMAEKTGATQRSFDKMVGPADKFEQLMASINIAALRLGDTLTSVLAPAAGVAADAINSLFGAEKQLSAIEKQKQLIAGLQSELASLNDRKNIPVYGDFFFPQREKDLLEQRIDDAIADLNKLEQKAAEAAKAGTQAVAQQGTTPLLPELIKQKEVSTEVSSALKQEAAERDRLAKAREREAQQAVEASQRTIDAFKRETEEIGKNAIQKRLLAAAAEAAKAPTQELAAEIMASAQAWAEATQQQEAALALQREQQQAAQARARAEADAARQVQQEWNQMWSTVENTARTSFIQFAAHGKDAMESIGDAIQNSIIDLLYQLTVRKWIINIGASMSGSLFGSSGALAGSGTGSIGMGAFDFANIGSSALNFASTGFGTTTMMGNSLMGLGGGVGSTLGSFGAGMVGGSEAAAFLAAESATAGAGAAAGFGASFASVAGPLAAAAIATQVFRAFAGDKRMGGGFGDALNTVGDIPILGDFIPVVPLMNSLFGRGPLKQKETNLIGDITASGFEGITSTKFKAQGGLARSDKVDRVMTDTDSGELLNQYGELVEGGISKTLEPFAEQASAYATQLGKILDDSISGISKSARTMADTLGVGSDALDNFSFGVNIASKKGQALTDEQIGQVIADASAAMARTLIPAIDSLSKNGESAYQTLQRISTEFNVLTGLGAALGNSLADTEAFLRDVSFEERSAFVAEAGGAEALTIKTQFFADNFLAGSERLKPSIEQLDREMSKLGLSAEISKRQFRDLVQSFGQAGGISEEMMQGLLNVAPLFAEVKDGLASLYPELQATADATYDLASAESQLADKRSALVAAYSREKTELEGVITRFSDLAANLRDASDALSLGSLSPLTPEQRLDEARNQFNQDRLAANAGDEAALQRLPQSAQAFLEASQVYNASSAEYVSDFNFVQQVLESAAVTAESQASIAELQLSELETSVGKLGVIDDHIVDLSTAMAEYTAAVLQGFGNLLVSDQQIRDFVSTHTVQESIDAAVQNGVSGSQVAGALGVDQSVINQATGGQTVSDQQIRDFVSLNPDPMAIYNAAIDNGISSARLAEVSGISLNDINQFVRDNNLATFAVGTDLVPRDGLAMLHKGEAVTPSSTVAEIKTIKRLLEVNEGIANTSSIVNRLAEDNESVANVKSISNQLAETNNNVASITSIVDRLTKVNEDKSITSRLAETIDSVASITSVVNRFAEIGDSKSISNRLTEFNERRVNNLASFAVGTDLVPRDGLAMLHKGEAVTPSSAVVDIKEIRQRLEKQRIDPIIYAPTPDIQRGVTAMNQNHVVPETISTLVEEVKALKNELTELRREQNQQTGALINVAIQSQKMNADMIIKNNQDAQKSAAWREQAKANIR